MRGNKYPLKPIATEQDILNAQPLDKLKLGEGLYLWINKKGNKKTFKFRIHFNGQDRWVTVGQYPAMSVEEARKTANTKYRADVENARQNKSDLEWDLHLERGIQKKVKSDIEKYPSFNNIEDAGEFIRNLLNYRPPSEIRLAIWLQMLMPSRTTELLTAKWSDFNGETRQWAISVKKAAKPDIYSYTLLQIEYISPAAHLALHELLALTGNGPHLFPSLCDPTISTTDRNKIIAKEIEKIWMKYPVTPATFRNFFITTANKESYFRPEFIKAMVTHKDGINSIYNSFNCIPQKRALAEWWGEELKRIKQLSENIKHNAASNIDPQKAKSLYFNRIQSIDI